MSEINNGYLCDVPVIVNVWIRPNKLRLQFDIIRESKPKTLFLVSDGGRNDIEMELIIQSRKIVENVNWECNVYKLYEDKNQGMYSMIKKSLDFVFSKVDRCIYLEDDYVPSVCYFRFCAELLEKYKDDKRILMINGMNHLGKYNESNSDYFFSNEGSIWGIAFWKRTYDLFNDRDFENDEYLKAKILDHARRIHKQNFAKKIISNTFNEPYLSGVEFNLGLIQLLQNQLIIVPTKNMINNIGFGDNAAHATELRKMPKGIRRVFNMNTYEYNFPLRHPKYVLPDYFYSKQIRKIMGYGYPLKKMSRKFESLLRHLIYGDYERIIKKFSLLIKVK